MPIVAEISRTLGSVLFYIQRVKKEYFNPISNRCHPPHPASVIQSTTETEQTFSNQLMRLFDFLLIGLIPFTIGNSVNKSENEISNRLDEIDLKFKSNGASLDILDDYDVILNDLEKLLSSSDFEKESNKILQKIGNTKFKHGVINLILKREKLAYNDFHSCIVTRNENNQEFFVHNGCFEKFNTLGLKLGHFNQVQDEVTKLDDKKISKLINKKIYDDAKEVLHRYKDELELLDHAIMAKNWEVCIDISNELAKIGPNDDKVIRNRIQCLLQTDTFGNKEDGSVRNYDIRAKLLSEDLNKLVNEEVTEIDLHDFVMLGEMEFFGITGIYGLQTEKILRNCLKIDNEFDGCRSLNKVNIKLNKLMKLLKDISIYYSFVYSNTDETVDGERVSDTELRIEDWKEVVSLLFDSHKKIKIKNASDRKAFASYGLDIDSLKSNFEILIELFVGFSKQIGFKDEEILSSSFLKDLFRLSKEAYYQIGEFDKYKKNQIILQSKYFKKVEQRNKSGRDIVDIARDLESFLKKKKMDKAKGLLDSLPNSMKLCRLIKEPQERFEQLRQQQQQQQHHHNQQHHQQQQQRPSKPFKPKNDYYKILGIGKEANADEIKKAYRQKMKENHPDKVKQQLKKEGSKELSEEEIETRVAEINNAYEILSDEEKRANYDRHGEDPNDPENTRQRQQWQQQQQQQQHFRGQGGGFQFQGFNGFDGFPGFQGFPGFNGNAQVKFGGRKAGAGRR